MAERRHYEMMMILDSRLEEASIQSAIDRATAVVTQRGGEVTKVDHWGRRKFTFEIRHMREGYYVVVDMQIDPETVTELDRVLKLADEVIRHKVVRPGKD